MGKYQMDMKGENKNSFELPDGWHPFEIVKVDEHPSAKCTLMFKVKLVHAEDATVGTDVYFVGDEKRRWFLKELLTACGCPAGEDGVYDWSPEDIEGQTVLGRVEHQQEDDWIDRKGVTRPGQNKARLVEFKALGAEKVQ